MRSDLSRHHAQGLWRQRLLLAFAGILVLTSGCAKEPEPIELPDPPTADQLREDVVGVTFVFIEDADGEREWTIEAPEVRRLDIVDQVLDDSGRVARSRVSLLLRAEQRSIRGDLVLRHRREGVNWVLEEAGRSGPNWQAGDARALLFSAEAVTDTTGRSRTLLFSPIARYEDGLYLEPLAPFRDRARALADSTFETDSLRQSAESELNQSVKAAIATRGSSLWALGPGRPPARVSVDSLEVSMIGCQYVSAFARAPSSEALAWAELGTTSSIMGSPVADGKPVERSLGRALDRIARERFEIAGANVQRIRQRRSIAADLDGDGVLDGLGVFSVGEGDRVQSIAVAVTERGNDPVLRFERRPARADGYTTLDLLGVVDVDGDGASEAIFVEEGYEIYRYLIVTFRAGRFTDVFRGGGGGC